MYMNVLCCIFIFKFLIVDMFFLDILEVQMHNPIIQSQINTILESFMLLQLNIMANVTLHVTSELTK